MALTADREAQHRDGVNLVFDVAASTKIYGGSLVSINAAGTAIPAADTASTKVVGVSDENVDNSGGSAADLSVKVRRGRAFKFKNSVTNAVAVAHLFTNVYVEDDETVASAGGTNSIVAGKCIGIDSDGVWIEI